MKRILALIIGLMLLTSALPTLAQSAATVYSTAQRFERGLMIWRSDTSTIYVLADNGRAYTFPAWAYSTLPPNRIPASAGQLQPINGFGRVWASRVDIRSAIGWPVRQELGFDMGVMVNNADTYLRQLDGTVYDLRYGRWTYAQTQPTPVPGSAVITQFDVSPTTVTGGNQVFVTWDITGAPNALLEFYNAATGELLSTTYGLSPDGGLYVPAPFSATGMRIVLTAAAPKSSSGDYTRLTSAERIVQVTPGVPTTIGAYAAFQPYQSGFMIWHNDNGNVEVFYNSGQHEAFSTGAYASFPDNPYSSAPAGLVAPINGFGRVWSGFDHVRNGLGWATTWETGYQLTISVADGIPVSFTLPDGRVAHTTTIGTWSFS